MNKLKFLQAMSRIDEDLIKDADIPQTEDITEENAVSGVEVYHGVSWQKYAALASAFLLIAGLGAAAGLLFRNNRKPAPDDDRIISELAPTTESNALAELEETTAANTTSSGKKAKQTTAVTTAAETEKATSASSTAKRTETTAPEKQTFAKTTAPAAAEKTVDTSSKPVTEKPKTQPTTAAKPAVTTAAATEAVTPAKVKMTLGDVLELSERGYDLAWNDLRDYEYVEWDTGVYLYKVYTDGDISHSLLVTWTPYKGKHPENIYQTGLSVGDITDKALKGDQFDIRNTRILKEFLNGTSKKTKPAMTTDELIGLSKKGCDLTWDDFRDYEYEDIGSGIFIYKIKVEGGYSLLVGGLPPENIYYILLVKGDVTFRTPIPSDKIDIRDGRVEEFINS